MIRQLLAAAALLPAALGAQIPAPVASSVPGTLPIDRVIAIVGDQPLLWTNVVTTINQRRAQGLKVPTDSVQQAALAHAGSNRGEHRHRRDIRGADQNHVAGCSDRVHKWVVKAHVLRQKLWIVARWEVQGKIEKDHFGMEAGKVVDNPGVIRVAYRLAKTS